MTKLLKEAFEQASSLNAGEQDAIAQRLLDDIAAEKQWDESFANSQDVLSRLADAALAESRAGLTLPLDPEAM